MRSESSERTVGTIITRIIICAIILSFLGSICAPVVFAKAIKENHPKPYVYSKGDSDGLAGYKFTYKNFQDYEDNESNDMLGGGAGGVSSANSGMRIRTIDRRIVVKFLLYHLSCLVR